MYSTGFTNIAFILPHAIPEMNDILVIRRTTSAGYADFNVRRKHVQDALEWLVANNPYYSDIVISQERLLLLPMDGNVQDILPHIITSTDFGEESEEQGCTFESHVITTPKADHQEGCDIICYSQVATKQQQQSKRAPSSATLTGTTSAGYMPSLYLCFYLSYTCFTLTGAL